MLRVAARALGTGIVFLAAVVLGFLVHLRVPAMQRAVVARVNAILSPLFVGKLTIDRVGALGLPSVAGIDAHMEDPEGTTVVRATGIAGRAAVLALLRSLVTGDIKVGIPEASLTSADVNLDTDSAGTLRIANAFAPRPPSNPSAPGPAVHLSMPRIHLDHVAVRGQIAGAPLLDGDVNDADASLRVDPGKVAVDVLRGRWTLRALPGGVDGGGAATAHLEVPAPDGHPFELHIATQAEIGAIAVDADASYDASHLDAKLDVPAAAPEPMRAIVPGWPAQAPLAVHAEAHGALPQLTAQAHAALGETTLDVSGPVTVVPRLQASLHVDAKHVDVRALAPASSPPRTDLAATGDLTVTTKAGGAVTVQTAMDIPVGTVGSVRTPAVSVNGQLARAGGANGEITASAKAAVHEPGAPTVVTARLVPKGRSFFLSFQAEANAPDLALVEGVRGRAKGRVLGQADGTIDLGASAVDAHLSLAGESLEAFGSSALAVRVQVHATGRLASPALDVQLAGEGIEVWRLQCTALTASGSVGIENGVTLRDVELATQEADGRVRAHARYVSIGENRVDVQDAVVKGFGAPIEGALSYVPDRLYLRARSGELDLARIARFVRVPFLHEGRVGLDIDASVGHGTADGRVYLDVSHASFGTFKDASARVEATLKGRQASGHVTANVADIGSIDVQSSSVQIGSGPVLSMASWRRAWGVVDAKAHVDLPKLFAQLPEGSVPIQVPSGVFDVTARVDRDSANDASPAVDIMAATTGLSVAGGGGSRSWRIDGVDPSLHVTVDGETGSTALEAALHDAHGSIVQIDATSSQVPYARISSGDGLKEALRAMPFDARVSFPERSLDTLPAVVGLGNVHGRAHGSLEWHGAVAMPTIAVDAGVRREGSNANASSLPFDLSLTAHYDGAKADATLQAMNRDKLVVDAKAQAEAKATDLLAGIGGETVPWTASAKAKLDGMSLRAFTFLSDRQVRGKATGTVTLDRLHDDAHANVDVAFDGLMVGDVASRAAHMQASLDGHAFDASARFEQPDGGYLDTRAHAGEHWGRALVPALDSSQPASIVVSAKKFRAQWLLPFASGIFAQLDGSIDADARLDIDPRTSAAKPQGAIVLSDGTFELVSLGGEFADVSCKVKLAPDGLITLEDFVAHPLTGKLQAAATLRMNGLAFAGASATVQVPKTAAIPVVVDGVQIGTLDARFDLTAEPAPQQGLDVMISAPSVHMVLPDIGAHEVQPLGDLEGVTTGAKTAGGFVTIPLDATIPGGPGGPPPAPVKLDIRLGNDVQVTRGTNLDVRLQGEPIVTIAEDVKVTGQIRLVRGTIDVQGKPFTIDNGTITFVGDDPSNPQVVLTAEWTAPDGTRVYADFVGPLKTGKVTLRSDPVLPGGQNDILALILTGTTETPPPGASGGTEAAGIAGGVAATPINQALGGVNKALDKFGLAGGISTKIEGSSANPRPEVEVQIARDISVQVGWVIGTPPPGTNPDTTLLTLRWRFLRKWSLEGTVGDAGTSIIDLIWQHRY